MFASIYAPRFPRTGLSRCSVPADRITIKCGWLLFGLLILLPPRPAWADLILAPTRIVFEKNQRAAQLDLINNGAETATYRISLVNRRMSETGEISAIDGPAPGEHFADALLRFSPRQVTLAPGVGQVVRIMLRKPADLAPGEYRSHLVFQRIADTKDKAGAQAQDAPAGKELEIKLTALIGASIPVIVRHGETAATVTLANLKLEKPAANHPPVLSLELRRGGNRSVYGDLVVTLAPSGRAEQVVARANGVAVYTPNPMRRARIALQLPAGAVAGTLRVVFQARPEDGGKPLAEATLPLR